MTGWDRVRRSLTCAYGCALWHGDWVYFGKRGVRLCEACAATHYGIRREGATARQAGEGEA